MSKTQSSLALDGITDKEWDSMSRRHPLYSAISDLRKLIDDPSDLRDPYDPPSYSYIEDKIHPRREQLKHRHTNLSQRIAILRHLLVELERTTKETQKHLEVLLAREGE